jgi:hypothetical protein
MTAIFLPYSIFTSSGYADKAGLRRVSLFCPKLGMCIPSKPSVDKLFPAIVLRWPRNQLADD